MPDADSPVSTSARRRTLAAVLACCTALAIVAGAFLALRPSTTADRPIIGVGDNGANMFLDKNFQRLDLTISRLVAPWDFRHDPAELERLNAWIVNARAQGVEPLIALERSHTNPTKLPSPTEYSAAVKYLRDRYPDVMNLTPWNEANHSSQPTARKPQRAAQYYNIVRKLCPSCAVPAADVLDQPDMIPWIKEFQRYAEGRPMLWGLHSYRDGNRQVSFEQSSTRKLLDAVEGKVWYTEVGGIVAFARSFPYDEQRAAESLAKTLEFSTMSLRIERVYLYSWYGTNHTPFRAPFKWDSGIVGPDAKPRPSYTVLKDWLGR